MNAATAEEGTEVGRPTPSSLTNISLSSYIFVFVLLALGVRKLFTWHGTAKSKVTN